jgi:hypothetical protein
VRKIIVVLLVLLAGSALACGSSGTKSESVGEGVGSAAAGAAKTVAPTTDQVGKTIRVTDSIFGQKTVAEITVKSVAGNVRDTYSTASRGQFVVADVEIRCIEGKYSANPFNFKYVDASGTVSDPTLPVSKPELNAVELAAGQNVTGKITFDVAGGNLAGGRVALKNFLRNGDAAHWTLGA